MKKHDALSLSPKTQEPLRKQAVRLKSKGKSCVDIAEIVGVHRHTVSRWWSAYCDGGADRLKSRPRGFQKGLYRKLTPAQDRLIQTFIKAVADLDQTGVFRGKQPAPAEKPGTVAPFRHPIAADLRPVDEHAVQQGGAARSGAPFGQL